MIGTLKYSNEPSVVHFVSRVMRTVNKIVMASAVLLLASGVLVSSVTAQTLEGENGDWTWKKDYSFDVDGRDSVVFEDFYGHVELVAGRGSSIVIQQVVQARGETRREALDYGNEFELEVRYSSSYLTIEGESGSRSTMFVIQVPSGLNVSYDSDSGDLFVAGMDSELNIKMDGGDVEIVDVGGPVDVRSDGGDIDVDGVKSDVSLTSDGGELTVLGVDGDLIIATGGGEIEIETVKGKVEVVSAGGSVEVSDVDGDVFVNTSAGGVEVDHVKGEVTVLTGGGDIELWSIRGSVNATTIGGDIEGDEIYSEMKLETMAGDIELEGVRSSVRAVAEVGAVEIEVIDASFLASGSLYVELGDGEIGLILPTDTEATIVAHVLQSGSIEIDETGWSFREVRRRGSSRRDEDRRAILEVGGGGTGEIELSVRKGEIIIENRNSQ